jgi:ferredoxin
VVAVIRRLRVDPIGCQGHGLCAELLPELISLDPWGYPIVAAGEVPVHLSELAAEAVEACPTLALTLVSVEPARSGDPARFGDPARPGDPARSGAPGRPVGSGAPLRSTVSRP